VKNHTLASLQSINGFEPKKRYAQKIKVAAKQAARIEKELARRARIEVKVGPLLAA